MEEQDKKEGLLLITIISFLLVGIDSIAFWLLFKEDYIAFWFFHLGCLAIVVWSLLLAAKIGYYVRFFWLLALLFLPFGPVGAAMILLAIPLYVVLRPSLISLEELIQAFLPAVTTPTSTDLYDSIVYGFEELQLRSSPIPFKDIMTYGTLQQKSIVLSKIIRYFRVEFASILRLGLQDQNNSIRVQAATTAMTVSRHYYLRYLKLLEDLSKNPKDLVSQLQFATFCVEYVESGFVEHDNIATICQQAIDKLYYILRQVPGQVDIIRMLMHLLLYSHLPKEALTVASQLNPKNPTPSDILELNAKALFFIGNYKEIRSLAKKNFVNDPDSHVWGSLWKEGLQSV